VVSFSPLYYGGFGITDRGKSVTFIKDYGGEAYVIMGKIPIGNILGK
jgi:hypothetical protein